MSKLVKDLISNELAGRYADIDSAVWVEIVGVDGNTTNEFRHELRKNEVRLEVVKNSLFRRAVAEQPLNKLATELEGPAALLTGGESAIDIAKLIKPWYEKMPGMKVRGALLEGEYLPEERCQKLDKMATKRDLQGQVAGAALAPGANLAGAIRSGGSNVAGCIKAMIGKLEDGETITKLSA